MKLNLRLMLLVISSLAVTTVMFFSVKDLTKSSMHEEQLNTLVAQSQNYIPHNL